MKKNKFYVTLLLGAIFLSFYNSYNKDLINLTPENFQAKISKDYTGETVSNEIKEKFFNFSPNNSFDKNELVAIKTPSGEFVYGYVLRKFEDSNKYNISLGYLATRLSPQEIGKINK